MEVLCTKPQVDNTTIYDGSWGMERNITIGHSLDTLLRPEGLHRDGIGRWMGNLQMVIVETGIITLLLLLGGDLDGRFSRVRSDWLEWFWIEMMGGFLHFTWSFALFLCYCVGGKSTNGCLIGAWEGRSRML